MLQNVSESKAERYKTTHNFFVLEDDRSNSLLQTYKQASSIKRNIGFEKCNTCVERTEVAMVVLIGLVVSIYSVLTYTSLQWKRFSTYSMQPVIYQKVTVTYVSIIRYVKR